MDKERVQEWVKALRSGEYVQGRGALRTLEDKRCCLGVACDLFVPERWTIEEHNAQWFIEAYMPNHMASSAVLPSDVARDIGIVQDGEFVLHLDVPESADMERLFTRFPGARRVWKMGQRYRKQWQNRGYIPDEYTVSLTMLNDSVDDPFTFSDIADVLEAGMEMPEVIDFDSGFADAFARERGK